MRFQKKRLSRRERKSLRARQARSRAAVITPLTNGSSALALEPVSQPVATEEALPSSVGRAAPQLPTSVPPLLPPVIAEQEASPEVEDWEDQFLRTLEAILLELAKEDPRFRKRLWISQFSPPEHVLERTTLGATQVWRINRLLVQRQAARGPRFRLYGSVTHDGVTTRAIPTPVGIEIWREIRRRMIRGQSELGRYLNR